MMPQTQENDTKEVVDPNEIKLVNFLLLRLRKMEERFEQMEAKLKAAS